MQTDGETHTPTDTQTDSVGDYRGVIVDHFVREGTGGKYHGALHVRPFVGVVKL